MSAEFSELCKKNYDDQMKTYLQAFWKKGGKAHAEDIWTVCQKFKELDPKGKDGNELDEWKAHQLLESRDATLTAIKMRECLRTIDADNNGHMAALEYYVWFFKKSIDETVNASKFAATPEALRLAQEAFDKVNAALGEVKAALEAVAAAEKELEEALAELKRQEDAAAAAKAKLQAVIDDPDASTVKKSKASNELAQMEAEDPLPVRRSKITAEAALRKVKKEKKVLSDKQAELQVEFDKCKEQVELAKQGEGVSEALTWVMERDLIEVAKYLPKAKQAEILRGLRSSTLGEDSLKKK